MGASPRFTFFLRCLQAGALAVAVCFSMGATDAGSRFYQPRPPVDVHLRLR